MALLRTLGVVTVTATRLSMPSFDIPAAISTVFGEQLRNDALGVALSDDISTVPGLLARNRNNYAQDQQISIRGFGANSTFGIRGVRVYQDGIPATGPDGQGQVSQFNLDSAARVEILRGPFSALYGNSSGGVIQIFTADGSGPPQLRTGVVYGSFGALRAGANFSGSAGPDSPTTSTSLISPSTAFAPIAVPRTSLSTARWATRSTMRASSPWSPTSLRGPMPWIPWVSPRRNSTPIRSRPPPPQASFKTRKSLQQQLGGLIYDLNITDAQALHVMGYLGHRIVEQYLSIPVMSAQAAPGSSGGVGGFES